MSDLRDELARTMSANWRNMHTNGSLGFQLMLADAILPIIERETNKARAEVADLIRAHRDAEAAYWAMPDDADDETARRLAAEVTRTYEALLESVEGSES